MKKHSWIESIIDCREILLCRMETAVTKRFNVTKNKKLTRLKTNNMKFIKSIKDGDCRVILGNRKMRNARRANKLMLVLPKLM